jgi:hypothetical protein
LVALPTTELLNKIGWSLVALGVGVAGFFAVAFASPYFLDSGGNGVGGVMGGSTGSMATMMTWWLPSMSGQYSYPFGLWVLPVAFLLLIAGSLVALGYLAVYPEIKRASPVDVASTPPAVTSSISRADSSANREGALD